ncbi:MAG: peroxiredoxin [Caldilineaceae bacterium]
MEATEFRDRIPQFDAKNVAVYGLSPDDIESHNAFAEKYDLNFPLLADADQSVLTAMGLWVQRERDGKTFMGALRTTMLVNEEGIVEKLWENVQFKDHAEEVLGSV